MNSRRLSTVSLLLISIFFCTTSTAQSTKKEQAELASLEQQRAELQARQQQLRSAVSKKKVQLQPLLKKAPPGKDRLDHARKIRDAADASYKAERTSANKSIRKNAEFKYALAQRKFRKANAERFTLERKIKDASDQLTALDSEVSVLTKRIVEQRQAVAKSRSQQQARERNRLAKAQKQARRQQQAKDDTAETARLKAQLEQLERDKQAGAVAAARAKTGSTQTAVPKSSGALASTPKIATSGRAKRTPAAKRVQNGGKTVDASPDNSFAVLLTTKEEVRAEKQRLQELLDKPGARKNLYRDKALFTQAVTANGKIKRPSRPSKLRALGHNQYRGKASLRAGEFIFLVDSINWQQPPSIDSSAGKYKIILDGADSNNPRLIYYPASLDN